MNAHDLTTARSALGDAAWEWFRRLAEEGELHCYQCFANGADPLWNDDGVVPATAPSIPFLVGFAAAGVHSPDLCHLVADIAWGTLDDPTGPAHRAVRAEVPLLLDLARTSTDEDVRRRAIRATVCGDAAEVLPVVVDLWAHSDDWTRGDALAVWLHHDPATARPIAGEALRTGSDVLRVLALKSLAATGAQWLPEHTAALAASLDGYSPTSIWAPDEPLHEIVQALVGRGDALAAAHLIVALLAPEHPADVRDQALWRADDLIERPELRPILLPAMIPLLDEPEHSWQVECALRAIEPQDARLADVLAAHWAGARRDEPAGPWA